MRFHLPNLPTVLSLALIFASRPHPSKAQIPIPDLIPFTIDGYFDSGSLDSTAFNSGGTITVMGNKITVPKNMQVQFPNTFVSWPQFMDGDLGGMAHEVIISGNVVNGTPIAGVIQVSGLILQLSNAVISAINADGSISTASGPTLRINDPTGKYGPAFTELPFFAVDPLSPSIVSFGGFPMCVPRSANDPQCPQSNRPAGLAGESWNVADGTHMVPFRVGDWLTYSGVEFNGEIVVYSIIANVGAYSEEPGFLIVTALQIAPPDLTNNVNLEAGSHRFTGYTTSDTAVVAIFALDQDPCTGEITERLVTDATPERIPVPGRYQFDVQKPVVNAPYTSQYRFRLSTGVINTTDGILGGQFDSPIITYIFPELITPGAPISQNDFSQFGWIANGYGPDENGNVFHQLDPFPGSPAPVPTKVCPDKIVPPTPSNGPKIPLTLSIANQTVLPGTQVTLFANQTAPNVSASDLSWQWTELSPLPSADPNITLSGATTETLSFVVPYPQTATSFVRTFRVVCTHIPTSTVANATVSVTSSSDPSVKDNVVIDSYTISSAMGGTVSVIAHTDLVADTTASLIVQFNSGAEIFMTKIGAGQYQFTVAHFGQLVEICTVTSFTSDGTARGSDTITALTS